MFESNVWLERNVRVKYLTRTKCSSQVFDSNEMFESNIWPERNVRVKCLTRTKRSSRLFDSNEMFELTIWLEHVARTWLCKITSATLMPVSLSVSVHFPFPMYFIQHSKLQNSVIAIYSSKTVKYRNRVNLKLIPHGKVHKSGKPNNHPKR